LIDQLQRSPSAASDPQVLHHAFLELGQGVAIGAVLWQEMDYAYLETRFESAHNPILTLIDQEVVCESWNHDGVVARGVLQLLDGNTLEIGDWQVDFSGANVVGTPFQDVGLELDEDHSYTISAAEYFDLINDDSEDDDQSP
jgi:hypothetical protein